MTGNDDDIDRALAEAARWMDQIPEVVSVGQGGSGDQPTVDVWVTRTPPEGTIPGQLHGFPVRVRPSGGPIEARNEQPEDR